MIDEVVEEIGEDNVVQVVTDNASNYKAAGEMLMEKRKKLYWTPCDAHCIDLMLEEFEKKIPIHVDTIYKGRKITRTHDERLIEDVVLDKKFSKNIVFVLKGAFLLIKVLRMVDSDDYEKPPMGLIYEAMDQAKEKIQSAYNGLEDRWDRQLHRLLHVARYFLNPQLHYAPGFIVDLGVHIKIRNKLKQETMNYVIFVRANSKLSKKKQARKGVKLTIDDISFDDEWIVKHNNEDKDHLDGPEGDEDDLMREILGEDIGEDIDNVKENEDEAPLEDINVNDLLN
ncbi:hypothetical protein Lal_00008584 [Lupinus albus]|nr:hypothetical protein Lal_00008584 [Lupinus albus]